MRVLVTGGAGNIGQEVVQLLQARDAEAVVYDQIAPAPGVGIASEKGDIGDEARLREIIAKHEIDSIAHLASMLQFGCEMEPAKAVRVNVMGTMAVLEAARQAGVKRVILSGTLATYGGTSDALDETSPIQADASLYGVTKLLCEKVARRYNALYGMDCRSLRYAAVLSPRKVSSPGVAAALATIFDAASGQDVVVKGVAAKERRQFAYTSDIALGTTLAVLAPKTEHDLFNIGGGDDCYASFQAVADLVRRFAPRAGRISFDGRSADRGRMNISRARRELGYQPVYTLERAVQTIVQIRLSAA